jgi:probable phosphoglycerate mutase
MSPVQATTKEVSVYLVRHAEAATTAAGRCFVGQSDLLLSASGMNQAHLLADHLRHLYFHAVYSSDLERCLMTAEIISAGRGLSVRREAQLREIDVGRWDGLAFEEIVRFYPREHAEREHDLVGCPFPGGESFRDLQRRVVPAFLRIVDGADGNTLVVAHKGVNRVLLAHVLGLPLRELFSIMQQHCCVNIITASLLPDGSRRMLVGQPMNLEQTIG